MAPRVVVVGSINLELVARVARLPRPGETLSGATFDRFPGGKGANQAAFFCLNAAPARPIDVEPDLLVVNRLEREVVGDAGRLVAVTLGADGAVLLEAGERLRGRGRRRSRRLTAPPPETPLPPVCWSRCSKAANATRRFAVPAPPARSRRLVSARNRHCRPLPR